jgi:hypothetical protein
VFENEVLKRISGCKKEEVLVYRENKELTICTCHKILRLPKSGERDGLDIEI